MIEARDLFWAAGFLDGEGYFAYGSSSPRVVCAQVGKELLERLQVLFGGSFWFQDRKIAHHQPVWYWEVGGSRAIQTMMTLYGLLSSKRQREIRMVLEKWKTKPIRFPNGMGIRNPHSPFYKGPAAHHTIRAKRAVKRDE